MQSVGIDGAKQGMWVLATCDHNGDLAFELTTDLAPLFGSAAAGDALIVIDVPIGILSGARAATGRRCDRQARAAVGPKRASSVFTPPCREALGAVSQEQASVRNRQACGLGVSCQAFGILNRIEGVDRLVTPELQHRVREGHPEVTFARLNGSLIEFAKKTREGVRERMAVLDSQGITFDAAAERRRLGAKHVSVDDLIDAVAMLVSARRIMANVAFVLGDTSRDSRGLLMQICA